MNASLYIGATGMTALSQGMNVLSNNIANVSTVGYKNQNIQFSDLMYAQVAGTAYGDTDANSLVGTSEKGYGVQVDTIRTSFTEGSFESSNNVTDLSIAGKGFYQLSTDNGELYYTRAGNFNFTKDGYLQNSEGLSVMGWPVAENGEAAASAEPVHVDMQAKMPSKASSSVSVAMNLGSTDDVSETTDAPYFSLLSGWDASQTPPLNTTAYSYSQTLSLYGDDGVTHEVQLYLDGAPSTADSNYVYEFLLASVPEDATTALSGDGLLMSGTLTFNSGGQLQDMMAYTPATAGSQQLADWTPAALSGGLPQMTVDGQNVTLNFGVSQSGDTWTNAPATAAEVGTDGSKLGGMTNPATSSDASTAYNGAFTTRQITQDGYPEGWLTDLNIESDGTIVADYSNNQRKDWYQLPICNFTSEDGLRREGGNLFSQAPEAGELFMGVAGSSNFGTVQAFSLESSNVDLATEMTNMIITQRGFQANSKVVSTADALLQKAMELKRS